MFERELQQLAAAIRAAVAEYKEANSVKTLRRIRVRRRDLSLTYSGDPQLTFERQRIEEDLWDFNDQEQFQDSIVKHFQDESPLYRGICTCYLVRKFPWPE
jgi:hypothetical protein